MMTWSRLEKNRGLSVLIAMIVAFVPFATAQSNYGALRGMVTDAQGASVTNASVALTAEDTKITRTTTSNGAGE